ncbi:hypothetical protein F7U66_01425 [Vibrio parahaemolyticus]|nr:hypothetical protein [Vibrio parahaemolyticus]
MKKQNTQPRKSLIGIFFECIWLTIKVVLGIVFFFVGVSLEGDKKTHPRKTSESPSMVCPQCHMFPEYCQCGNPRK